MTASRGTRPKVDALYALACGRSKRQAAIAAGVSPGTVSRWATDVDFQTELADLKWVLERRPLDGNAIMRQLDAAEKRLAPSRPWVDEAGRTHFTVTVPAYASSRQRRQIVARALAKSMSAAVDGRR